MRNAFTLLELLLAISILAVVGTVTFLTFGVATDAWQRSQELSTDLHHAEYIVEQLAMALRSAYVPDTGGGTAVYGFQLKNTGDGETARDEISWVKTGAAMVGRDCPFAGSPHRIRFTIEDDDAGDPVAIHTAWRVHGQAKDFDPDELEPVVMSDKLVGFDCRVAYEVKKEDGVDWLDDWLQTNRVPRLVELTVYMQPLAEGEEAVEIKRVHTIPCAGLSWP